MNQLTAQRAGEIVAAMRGRSVVVYGDVMLDEFVRGGTSHLAGGVLPLGRVMAHTPHII
jgi:bifunctional ADP-heptose synthase (sugar kinase/adenylyltransferase)